MEPRSARHPAKTEPAFSVLPHIPGSVFGHMPKLVHFHGRQLMQSVEVCLTLKRVVPWNLSR